VWATGPYESPLRGSIEVALLAAYGVLSRSVAVMGVPFAVVALGVLIWTRTASLESVRHTVLCWPLWTVVTTLEFVLVDKVVQHVPGARPDVANLLWELGVHALWGRAVGHGCVALAFVAVEFLDLTAFVVER
jgi:hypothetical protein